MELDGESVELGPSVVSNPVYITNLIPSNLSNLHF